MTTAPPPDELERASLPCDTGAGRSEQEAALAELAGMCRDLQLPLASLASLTDRLWKSPLLPVQREHVRALQHAGSALLAALEDVLNLPDAEPEVRAQVAPPVPAAAPALTGVPHILVADDSPDNQLLIQCYLKDSPYELEVVDNGVKAVDEVMSGRYHLVLMDIQMPEMDGWTATSAIRQWERNGERPPIPIIAVSAFARKEDHQRSLDSGCNLHVTKPVRRAVLLEAIRSHLYPEEKSAT